MAPQMGIIDALPEKDRSQGISYYSLFSYIPGIVGPVLALAVWQTGGMDYFTVVLIGIAVCTGVFGYTARMEQNKEEPKPAADASGLNVSMWESFGQLVKNPLLFRCSVLMLSASVVFGAVTTFIPLYASQIPSGNAGVYLMPQAGTVVLARIGLRKRIPSDGKWHSPFIMTTMSAAGGCGTVCELFRYRRHDILLFGCCSDGDCSSYFISNAHDVSVLCFASIEPQCTHGFIYCDSRFGHFARRCGHGADR